MKLPRIALANGAALTVAVAACGGATPPAASPEPAPDAQHAGHGEHGEHARDHEAHERAMPPVVKDFHATLAPLWHSEKNAERVSTTCAQAAALHDKAGAIAGAPGPDGADPAAWSDRAQALVNATSALVAECAKEGRAGVEAKLTDVHESFHALVDPRGAAGH